MARATSDVDGAFGTGVRARARVERGRARGREEVRDDRYVVARASASARERRGGRERARASSVVESRARARGCRRAPDAVSSTRDGARGVVER